MTESSELKKNVLWLMGPTSSGKTTISELLLEHLRMRGNPAIHYDGDEVRNFFGDTLGFKAEDRLRVVGTLVHLSNKASKAGLNVIVSALTANQDARQLIRSKIDNLLIGYVRCPVDICAMRDPKGLYKKAKKGEINTLIGYNSNYMPPDNPDIIVDTATLSLEQSITHIIEYLKQFKWIV
jgi:adenylylsulfate kinase